MVDDAGTADKNRQKITFPRIWKVVSVTFQSGRYTPSYPRGDKMAPHGRTDILLPSDMKGCICHFEKCLHDSPRMISSPSRRSEKSTSSRTPPPDSSKTQKKQNATETCLSIMEWLIPPVKAINADGVSCCIKFNIACVVLVKWLIICPCNEYNRILLKVHALISHSD